MRKNIENKRELKKGNLYTKYGGKKMEEIKNNGTMQIYVLCFVH